MALDTKELEVLGEVNVRKVRGRGNHAIDIFVVPSQCGNAFPKVSEYIARQSGIDFKSVKYDLKARKLTVRYSEEAATRSPATEVAAESPATEGAESKPRGATGCGRENLPYIGR
jgi:hypothetical protein